MCESCGRRGERRTKEFAWIRFCSIDSF